MNMRSVSTAAEIWRGSAPGRLARYLANAARPFSADPNVAVTIASSISSLNMGDIAIIKTNDSCIVVPVRTLMPAADPASINSIGRFGKIAVSYVG